MKTTYTGKASIDKPWLNYYPEAFRDVEVPKMTIESFLKMKNPDENKYVIEYYGKKYTYQWLWEQVDAAAKSLKAVGFQEGDRIPLFVQAVPAHYILLLAAERIGAAILCRDDTPEELCFAIRKTTTDVAFTHDYLSAGDEALMRETTQARRIVKISPYDYADRASMPDYVQKNIERNYETPLGDDPQDMTWEEFLALGESYQGDYRAKEDPDRSVFGAYTSGSTGVSKLVIHSSANIVAVAYQMSIFVAPSTEQEKWWLPILTPALIAATVSMTLFPLSAGLYVILDPYCPSEDIDIQFMKYKPNYWALIPMFCEILMKSTRIPDDYDMSHLRSIGTGAEPMNERKTREVEEFFHKHNCMAPLSAGYGQSEGCSNFTLPNPLFPLVDGCVGMPMPATTMAIFDPDTLEEKEYGQIGEVCMDGPAKMLHYGGFSSGTLTERTLVLHPDGIRWLHTGDMGYITKDGIVYILGRGDIQRYGGGILYMMRMESKVVLAPGVKDGFFCFVPDKAHPNYYVPYLFVILEDGKTVDDVREGILDTLETYEYPVDIRTLTERPYFHFKTNRKELTEMLVKESM